jgi:hypothetical protein
MLKSFAESYEECNTECFSNYICIMNFDVYPHKHPQLFYEVSGSGLVIYLTNEKKPR